MFTTRIDTTLTTGLTIVRPLSGVSPHLWSDHTRKRSIIHWCCHPKPRQWVQGAEVRLRAVLGGMQFTLHATRRTPHGASRLVQAMSTWLVETRRTLPRHSRDARVYGHNTAKPSNPPPPLLSVWVPGVQYPLRNPSPSSQHSVEGVVPADTDFPPAITCVVPADNGLTPIFNGVNPAESGFSPAFQIAVPAYGIPTMGPEGCAS